MRLPCPVMTHLFCPLSWWRTPRVVAWGVYLFELELHR